MMCCTAMLRGGVLYCVDVVHVSGVLTLCGFVMVLCVAVVASQC